MVTVEITADPSNPNDVPRQERHANLESAAIHAMRCGWSCTIAAPPRPLLQIPEFRVRIEGGVLVDGNVDEEACVRWRDEVRRLGPIEVHRGPS